MPDVITSHHKNKLDISTTSRSGLVTHSETCGALATLAGLVIIFVLLPIGAITLMLSFHIF